MRVKFTPEEEAVLRSRIQAFLERDVLTDEDRKNLQIRWENRDKDFVAYIVRLEESRDSHRGLWITEEAAQRYQAFAEALPYNGRQDIGERRTIRIVFQELYGLPELEALNIMNGYNVSLYLQKYDRIRNLIPDGAKGDRDKWISAEESNRKIDGLNSTYTVSREENDTSTGQELKL